jgi:hypothetical protein
LFLRSRVAENPATPRDVLLLLTEDEAPEVRLAVAKNSNTRLDILAVLAEDLDEKVEQAALQRFYDADEE